MEHRDFACVPTRVLFVAGAGRPRFACLRSAVLGGRNVIGSHASIMETAQATR